MRLLTISLLAATLGWGAIAFAQSSETEQTENATQTEQSQSTEQNSEQSEETTTADEVFPTAQSDEGNADGPKDGQQYILETSTDWQIRCIKGAEAKTCTLYQLLKDENDNAVAEFNMQALPAGGQAVGGVTFISPLGTLLTAQATMRIDSGKARRYPFTWCEQSGCVARFGLTQAEVDAMKRGAAAVMTLVSVSAPETPISLNLSLSGFTAGYDRLAEIAAGE